MTASANTRSSQDEYPPRADLRKMLDQQPLPVITPGTVDVDAMVGDEPTKQATAVLSAFNAALAADNAAALEDCFFASQAYWKDQLALTYHMRTFYTPSAIAASFLETKSLRGISGELKLQSPAGFLPATPTLQFIDFGFVFTTTSLAASCSGRMLLLPTKTTENGNEVLEWKIWILSTKLDNLDLHAEDEGLLKSPAKALEGLKTIETDVFIIGGGNAAVALAARLKTLGVESVMAERNPKVGDNWALRYDCMRFHIPTSFCELPYMTYDKELQSPHLLSRDELAEQVRRYVSKFNLNIINSVKIQSTTYDQSAKQWIVKFETPAGQRTAVSKHLVQATGIGSQQAYLPPMEDTEQYKGISLHSVQYTNAKKLTEQGAKSVLIIGSANTAFDVLEDCHAAGLQSTMVVRSPTYIVPVEYVCDKFSLGAYDFGVEAADRLFLTLPSCVDSQLGRGLFGLFASKEPDRYAALAAKGFPVVDSSHPDSVLMHNLLERAGGHYVDIGGTNLLTEGKADFKAGVEPVAYTATGLRFSDGTTADADAIVWCTGFADKDVRDSVASILGDDTDNGKSVFGEAEKNVLGPRDIASRIDATWGVDEEGEIRGMWKRHLRLDNYWVMGGYTQQHRWHSRTLALQIKAALEGILPPAYRDVPRKK
ncbi:monooxygenase [Ilyonectria sp. MPI-CAGE-AT-0026]|nr:monooxygenase [Ilyonectria sp. MPI-CAGE-AT-0026]